MYQICSPSSASLETNVNDEANQFFLRFGAVVPCERGAWTNHSGNIFSRYEQRDRLC